MEHIKVTDLGNGFKRLVPENGYTLFNRVTGQYYSEAVTKTPSIYEARKENEA